jgi:branched-chain amino acid transport system ATP-binding protein
MSAPVLQIDRVSISFGGLAALRDVSFEVAEKQIYGLIGPNGAGKTTLFGVIAGALLPSSGKVLLRGGDLTGKKAFERVHCGVVRTHQVVAPFRSMTVLENVLAGLCFGRHGLSRAGARDRAMDLLTDVGLEGQANERADLISLGYQKRLEVARAIGADPDVLLCDEICGGLSLSETQSILELLRKIRERGTTILYVEHDVKAIMSVCDRVLVLNSGERLAEDTPEGIQNNPAVVEAYLGRAAAKKR